MSCRIVYYTYEADVHCEPCAIARFGTDADGHLPSVAKDSEGNEPGVTFEWDDVVNPLMVCGTCGCLMCGHCGITWTFEDDSGETDCWNCFSPIRDTDAETWGD